MSSLPLVRALAEAIPDLRGADVSSVILEGVAGGDVNEAYRARSPRGFEAFVKTRRDAPAGTFEAEARGLALLRPHVRTPAVLAASSRPPFLALAFVRLARRGSDERLGEAIARVHRARVRRDDLPPVVWIGPLELPNRLEREPCTFFRLRVAPLLRAAPADLEVDATAFHALERAFDERLAGRPNDRLLHGDLWSGNAAFDEHGEPLLFDPAVGAGDPEADLAMMELFGGFSSRVWAAYRAVLPPEPGAERRRSCYELFPLLVHHALFGGGYTARCRARLHALVSGP
jgi:fructosamine-3-kinase